MSWFPRLMVRMGGIQLAMALVEFAAFLLYREQGINRLYWVPLSFALVAFAGYDTVKRLPLVWGAFVGAALAIAANLLSWPTGSLVADGVFRFPPEADPLLVGTSLLIAAIVGAIVGVVAGMAARSRRRQRSRRSALGKLAYQAYDEPMNPADDVSGPVATPMAERADRR